MTTNASDPGAPTAPKAPESTTYAAMLDEVDRICRDVGAPELDLDQMVAQVERGYALIKTMRARLDETRQRIDQLRLEFE
jgi:exodeoxyribonuclease VII small subunit